MENNQQYKFVREDVLRPPFNDIKPYFSAVIYEIHDFISLDQLFQFAKIQISKENKDADRKFYFVDESYIEDTIAVITICEKSIPSWLASKRIYKRRKEHYSWEDYNVHLALIYITGNYLFLSVKNSKILTFFQNAIKNIDHSIITMIKRNQFEKTRAFQAGEAKMVGLKNTLGFGISNKVPETKSYTGKNVKKTLNARTDHIFRLSYLTSSHIDHGYSGASVEKRKVWGGWTDSLMNFHEICDQYAQSLGEELIVKKMPFGFLAAPSNFDLIIGKKPVFFQLNAWKKDSGVLCLKVDEKIYSSWNTEIPQYDSERIHFTINTGKEMIIIKVNFKIDEHREVIFSYSEDNEHESNVVFQSEKGEEPRGRDLVKHLNKIDDYTFVFQSGIAFTNKNCYKVNKIANSVYNKAITDIKWAGVDITKEEATPIATEINILNKLEKYCSKLEDILYVVNDNGANEVADLVLIFKSKVVFVHAKASKTKIPGLRIGDLHIVCSQAIKNLNFVSSEPYLTRHVKRLHGNICFGDKIELESFSDLFLSALDDPAIKKEVWIVQPGISKSKLEEKVKNKAHTLLTYCEVVLDSAQIDFEFYCNN